MQSVIQTLMQPALVDVLVHFPLQLADVVLQLLLVCIVDFLPRAVAWRRGCVRRVLGPGQCGRAFNWRGRGSIEPPG